MNFVCKFPFSFIFFVKFSRTFWYISYEDNKKHDIFCPTDTGQTNPSGKETLFGGVSLACGKFLFNPQHPFGI
jgi:hypothetical protein